MTPSADSSARLQRQRASLARRSRLARLRGWLGELRALGAQRPFDLVAALGAFVLGLYVVAAPFLVARYPMMTDFPFHAANSAILRHYLDPSWHLREQFDLQPLSVPYVSMYALAALLMLVLAPIAAAKASAVVMLALLPIGLAVMFHGMRKSPLLGLTGLGLVWCGLTHWGFLNFMGALGLFAMAIGVTLRLLAEPSRGKQLALALVLCAIFFTHVFRFPFAIAAVVGTTVVMAPATRRWRPVVLPLLAPLALLAAWWALRPAGVASSLGPLHFDPHRLELAGGYLYRSLRDPAEARAAGRALELLGWLAIGSAGLFIAQGRWYRRSRRELAWGIGVTLVPLCCAAVFLALYLTLPMEIGLWWYVFPRELTAAAFIALGALPDLPRQGWLRAAAVLLIGLAVVPLGRVVVTSYRQFDATTRDFDAVVAHIPQAPRLLYLVLDHQGSSAVNTPYIHLPAYVQALRGGWLSFHFATWGISPMPYRKADEPGAVVPPPTPLRWEWTPQRFRVREHGPFFEWFLVRSRASADALFREDPSIHRVAHEGTWWLYQRAACAAER